MGLQIYDVDKELFGENPFRAFADGHLGGSYEELIYLRNDDSDKWYSHISIMLEGDKHLGEFGETGFSFKFIFGARRPTEAEWDAVMPNMPVGLPNIGSSLEANTHNYFPVWVRVFVPGGTPAMIKDNLTIALTFYERLVTG